MRIRILEGLVAAFAIAAVALAIFLHGGGGGDESNKLPAYQNSGDSGLEAIGPSTPVPTCHDPDEIPYGNCWSKGELVEVFNETAAARGGRVFDAADGSNTRLYSLPSGGCLSLAGAITPPGPPDWLSPEREAELATERAERMRYEDDYWNSQPTYGNCRSNVELVEVTNETAAAKGGRVFEYADRGVSLFHKEWNLRFYSLPDGGCVLLGPTAPQPDWVSPRVEAEMADSQRRADDYRRGQTPSPSTPSNQPLPEGDAQ